MQLFPHTAPATKAKNMTFSKRSIQQRTDKKFNVNPPTKEVTTQTANQKEDQKGNMAWTNAQPYQLSHRHTHTHTQTYAQRNRKQKTSKKPMRKNNPPRACEYWSLNCQNNFHNEHVSLSTYHIELSGKLEAGYEHLKRHSWTQRAFHIGGGTPCCFTLCQPKNFAWKISVSITRT